MVALHSFSYICSTTWPLALPLSSILVLELVFALVCVSGSGTSCGSCQRKRKLIGSPDPTLALAMNGAMHAYVQTKLAHFSRAEEDIPCIWGFTMRRGSNGQLRSVVITACSPDITMKRPR